MEMNLTLTLQVVLDLDETLVCAYESTALPQSLHSQALRSGIKWFELQCVAIEKVATFFLYRCICAW
jgi:RNA polymerase II subunit A small phosphatase-like protein